MKRKLFSIILSLAMVTTNIMTAAESGAAGMAMDFGSETLRTIRTGLTLFITTKLA
ncbi:MAG: hypothetical protein MJ146_00240 [Clostridia bacterium]|nr:hypothetical protein [Clostridia bacterium]